LELIFFRESVMNLQIWTSESGRCKS